MDAGKNVINQVIAAVDVIARPLTVLQEDPTQTHHWYIAHGAYLMVQAIYGTEAAEYTWAAAKSIAEGFEVSAASRTDGG